MSRRITKEQIVYAAQLARKKQTELAPRTKEADEALRCLHAELVQCAEAYGRNDLAYQRASVAASLTAVAEYLISQGIREGLLTPILRPAYAIHERERNSLDLLFCERNKGGRPKRTEAGSERMGVLAALADHWLAMHEGHEGTLNLKLETAARQMAGPWFGNVSRAQLQAARDLVSQEARDHPAVIWSNITAGMLKEGREIENSAFAFASVLELLNSGAFAFGMGTETILKTPHVSPDG